MNENEKFYNLTIKKVLTSISGMLHQRFARGMQARDIHQEPINDYYKENSNMIWGEFLTTKFGLWIDTRSSADNTLHGMAERNFTSN